MYQQKEKSNISNFEKTEKIEKFEKGILIIATNRIN